MIWAGTSYELLDVEQVFPTLKRIDLMQSLFISQRVVATDLRVFQENLQGFLAGKLTTVEGLTVDLRYQDNYKTAEGCVEIT